MVIFIELFPLYIIWFDNSFVVTLTVVVEERNIQAAGRKSWALVRSTCFQKFIGIIDSLIAG